MKILIVEDDLILAEELRLLCKRWGFEAEYLQDFSAVDVEAAKRKPELILLDITLPSFDGFYWCERIRRNSNVPVLFLSSREQAADKRMAMMAGGDDYVEKPFDSEFLALKMRAMLRRAYEYTKNDREYLEENIYYDRGRQALIVGETEIEFTRSEGRIFHVLLSCKGMVVSRERLMESLWNTDEFVTDASLSVIISRLRGKIRQCTNGKELIHTRKGQGYYIR